MNPLNEDWGYTRTDETIFASFQEEATDVEVSFVASDTMMTYLSSATLIVPAEFELVRTWALFSFANDPDPATFKRTVYLIQRQADVWALHNIYARFRGNVLSHFEIELIQLHRQAMGSRAFYNPFAMVFELDSDVPYSQFVLNFDDLFDEIGVADSSVNPSLFEIPT